MSKTTNHAFYSPTAEKNCGFFIYKDMEGKEIRVTGVFNTKESGEREYKFKDKVYMGEVSKYVSRIDLSNKL